MRALLTGPERAGRVAGVVPSAVYVLVAPGAGSHGEVVVALESGDGLGLPCAVVVPERAEEAPFAAVQVGDGARVGGGRLQVGPLEVAVVRWWTPRRPRQLLRPTERGVRALEDLLPPLEDGVQAAAEPLRAWVVHPTAARDEGRTRDAVRRLVGLGSGLTPAGDDVLVGALVTLSVRDEDRFRALAAAVRSLAPGRTTSLSATLLEHAADGAALPALAAVVDALADPPPPDLGARIGRLLAVGHSSGAALAHGVALAIAQ